MATIIAIVIIGGAAIAIAPMIIYVTLTSTRCLSIRI